MQLSDKPVIREFYAAARLANEWRDTIVYTVLAAAVTAEFLHNKRIDWALIPAEAREVSRATTWFFGPHKQLKIAGRHSSPINHIKCAFSAMASTFTIDALYDLDDIVTSRNFIHLALVLSALGTAVWSTGGPRQVLKTYGAMWDYPRKNDGIGGGTTQTERFLDGLHGWSSAFGNAAMQPAYVPIKRPRNGLRHLQNRLQRA